MGHRCHRGTWLHWGQFVPGGGQEVALGLRVSPGGAEGAAQPHQQLRGRRCVTLGGSSPHPKPPDGFGVTNKGGDGSVQPSDPTQDHPAPPTAELSPRVPPVPPSPRSCPLCVPPNPSRTPKAQPRPVTPRWVSLSPLPGPARPTVWLPVKPVNPSAAPAAPGVAGPSPAARPCPELDADPAAVPDAVCIPRQAGIFLIKPASLDAI